MKRSSSKGIFPRVSSVQSYNMPVFHLRNDGQAWAQIVESNLTDVDAINEDATALCLHNAEQRQHQSEGVRRQAITITFVAKTIFPLLFSFYPQTRVLFFQFMMQWSLSLSFFFLLQSTSIELTWIYPTPFGLQHQSFPADEQLSTRP